MKKLFAILMLVGASALFSTPCSAVTLTYNVIYYQPGNHGMRIPHVGNAGGFEALNVNMYPYNVDNFPSGSNPVTLGGTPTLTINTVTYALAFASVLGGKEGGATAFPNSIGYLPANVPVDVGSSNITVNYVYFPVDGPGGAGGGGPVAWLGEVDEMSGNLLWDYFVTVYSPQSATTQDNSLTGTGNIHGFVSTASAGVRINAYSTTTTGGSFDRWTSEPVMPNVPSSRDLDVNSGASTTALAAYHSSCPPGYWWNAGQYISQCTVPSGPVFKPPYLLPLCAIVECLFRYFDQGDPAPDRFVNGVVVVGGQIGGVTERDGVVTELFVSRGSVVAFVGGAQRTMKVVETERRTGFGNLDIGASERGHVLTGLALDRSGRFFGTLYTKTTISRGQAADAGLRASSQKTE